MNVLLFASLVLKEASRRRLLLTVAALTIAMVALTGWGFHRLATLHGSHGQPIPHYAVMVASSVLVIMMAFMFSIILCLGASFLGALSTGTEIENGTLLAVVPRPVTRFEIFLGKWLGNAVLVAAYAAIIAGAEFTVVRAMTGYAPPHPLTAIAFLIAQCLLVLTVTMALSVRLSSIAAGFTTVVLFGVAWIGGAVGMIAGALNNTALQHATLALSLLVPTDGLWRGAVFALEPAVLAATAANPQGGNPFVTAASPSAAYLLWCAGWFACVFAAAILSFSRRDI